MSALHAWVAAEVMQAVVVAHDDGLPRDGHHVLGLLHELLVELGDAARPEVKEKLKPIKGSSKTAKLAKAIVSLDATQRPPAENTALMQHVEALISRGEAWAAGSVAAR